jgi:Protein of unknown function (DUF3575)
MKRILILLTFAVLTAGSASAQVDIKVGPLGLLFNQVNFGIEFAASPNVGIELTPGIDWKPLPLLNENDYNGTIFRVGLNGRYYFNPTEKKLNGFYAGAYTRYGGGKYTYDDVDNNIEEAFSSTRLAGGFLLGGKIVSKNEKIIFDLGIGFGRAFIFKFEDLNGSNDADLSNIPFVNFDMPINLKIGYRITGKN